jgi:hypothetical protein
MKLGNWCVRALAAMALGLVLAGRGVVGAIDPGSYLALLGGQ